MTDTTTSEVATPWYLDKPLKAVLGMIIALVGNAVAKKWGIELNTESITAMVVTVVGYIVSYKWKGAIVQRASIENLAANAQSQATKDLKAKIEVALAMPSDTEKLEAMADILRK